MYRVNPLLDRKVNLLLMAAPNPPGGQAATRPAPIRPPRTAAIARVGHSKVGGGVSSAPETAVKEKVLRWIDSRRE